MLFIHVQIIGFGVVYIYFQYRKEEKKKGREVWRETTR